MSWLLWPKLSLWSLSATWSLILRPTSYMPQPPMPSKEPWMPTVVCAWYALSYLFFGSSGKAVIYVRRHVSGS